MQVCINRWIMQLHDPKHELETPINSNSLIQWCSPLWKGCYTLFSIKSAWLKSTFVALHLPTVWLRADSQLSTESHPAPCLPPPLPQTQHFSGRNITPWALNVQVQAQKNRLEHKFKSPYCSCSFAAELPQMFFLFGTNDFRWSSLLLMFSGNFLCRSFYWSLTEKQWISLNGWKCFDLSTGLISLHNWINDSKPIDFQKAWLFCPWRTRSFSKSRIYSFII